MNTLDKEMVQAKLNLIGYQKPFKVIFLKSDGSQRLIEEAIMEKPTKPIDYDKSIPVMDVAKGGWSSFKADKVLYLETI